MAAAAAAAVVTSASPTHLTGQPTLHEMQTYHSLNPPPGSDDRGAGGSVTDVALNSVALHSLEPPGPLVSTRIALFLFKDAHI